jgi:hypothetical protein
MKINEKILSIPPYISTTWKNISAIGMKSSQLFITLADGDTIHIPGLEKETIDLIFLTHAEQIEKYSFQETEQKAMQKDSASKELSFLSQSFLEENHLESSLKFGFATLDGINTVMQHNPLEMNAPDLPQAVLEKIGSIAKILSPEDSSILPTAVPNCNCFHCQITRAINLSVEVEEILLDVKEDQENDDEPVSDLELQFNQWEVSSESENLFTVKNKLDTDEHYIVYLGTPVGCNCGMPNCEHIIAALRA